MDSLVRDLRYAMRSIAGSKKFSAIVIVTLALGIGANTAVFGVLNAVVLTPLPYDEPERLVRVYKFQGAEDNYLPGSAVLAFRERSKTLDFAAVYTYSGQGADLTDRPEPERVRTMPVSADYFRVLHVRPMLGQVFDRAVWNREIPANRAAVAGVTLVTLAGIKLAGVKREQADIAVALCDRRDAVEITDVRVRKSNRARTAFVAGPVALLVLGECRAL